MLEKFTARDGRFILTCLLVAAVSGFIGIKYFYKAFPEAVIHFRVNKDTSQSPAEAFLRARGISVRGYRHAARFSYDSEARTFLEKEMGLDAANRWTGSRIRLWRWTHRWFQPLQKEEIRVGISPQGDFVEFAHQLPEERAGAEWTAAAARQAAEAFLTGVVQRPLADLEFIEATAEKRPHRTDHRLTWEDKAFKFQDASYRLEVTIQGGEVGGYREYLKVPESWKRSYSQLRSKNDTTSLVAMFFSALLIAGMLVVIVQRARHKDIRWRVAGAFGAIGASLALLSAVNGFANQEFHYDTRNSYGSFLIEFLLTSLLSAVAQGGLIFIVVAAAESVYRHAFPDRTPLGHLWRWRTLRTKMFFRSACLGVTLAFFFFAYQTGFYILASRLGAWAPAEIPYDGLLNTKIPWAFVLFFGFFPAVSEELIYRGFAIPLLQRWGRSRALAVILAAIIWGFAHAGYPNQPFYIRGLEVGIGGLIVGGIMLRYNILVTLIWHYTVDALYTAILLLRSGNPYLILSGGLSSGLILVPLAVAALVYVKKGGFEPEERPALAPPPPVDTPAAPEPAALMPYEPLSARRLAIGLLLVGLLLSGFWLGGDKVGPFARFHISAAAAENLADRFLLERGVRAGDFQRAVVPQLNYERLVAKYIAERASIAEVNKVFTENLRSVFWAVRYFKPGEKEEYMVYVDPERSRVYTFTHTTKEDQSGAELTREAAQAKAETFLQSQGIRPEAYTLVENATERRKHRVDHRFVWEANAGDPRNYSQAKYRMQVTVEGDAIARFDRFMKLPEEWLRYRQRSLVLASILNWSRYLFGGGIIVLLIWLFFSKARAGQISWRVVLPAAGVMACLSSIEQVNQLASIRASQPTTIPASLFLIGNVVILAMAFLGWMLAGTLLLGTGYALYPRAFDGLRSAERRRYVRDALIVAGLILGGVYGLEQWQGVTLRHLARWWIPGEIALLPALSAHVPFLSAAIESVLDTVTYLSVLGTVLFLFRSHARRPARLAFVLVVVGSAVFASSEIRNAGEFAVDYVSRLVRGGLLVITLGLFLRGNVLAYIVSFSLLHLARAGLELGTHPAFRAQAGRLGILVGAWILGLLWYARRGSGARAVQPQDTTSMPV